MDTAQDILSRFRDRYLEKVADAHGRTRWSALADAIGDLVREGALLPGDRLPTHRELGEHLGVTTGTVTRAYAETARRGLTVATVGRGTFVAEPGKDVDVYAEPPVPVRLSEREKGQSASLLSPERPVDMGFITPFEHLNPSLSTGLAKLLRTGNLEGLGGYQEPGGLGRHREAGALWAARFGLPVPPDNVLVCAGAQHALLVVLASMFSPGDRVAADQLTYPLLRQLGHRLRLQLVPVRMDRHGMVPASLEAACRSRSVRGLYLMPSCHNPTLAMIPEARRQELVEICRRHDVLVVEDDVYALSLERRLPPMARLAPERTFFVASTSEALGAGLRIAYLCAPTAHLAELERTISYTVSMAPPLMAELASMWITDGTAETVLAAKREAARNANTLARRLLDGCSLETRTTGFYCWLRTSEEDAGNLTRSARDAGIIVAGSSCFALGADASLGGVRLALGLKDPDRLEAALTRLAELVQKGGRQEPR